MWFLFLSFKFSVFTMWQKLKNKLQQVQKSDERTKKYWIVILSGISMTIVVAVWFVYLNSTIKRVEEESTKQLETTFWQVFRTGLEIVGNSIKEKSADLIYKIIGERMIEIK